jgi:N-acylneuraminate cytidylyltransferase
MDDRGTDGPVIAIIPARGGSKRIPRKNARPFLGRPIIARTIEHLLEAGVFDQVVVSTDDDEISTIAREAGGQVPFRRPDELANDLIGTEAVVRHAIESLETRTGRRLGLVCAVYPTAVLVTPEDIRDALRVLREDGVDYVFSATSFPYPIQRALRRRPDGSCEMFHPHHLSTRSQDLEPAYHDAGQFYWGRRDAWIDAKPVFTANSRFYLVPRYRVQDIDTIEDWRRAEMLHRVLEER